jgi:HK97 family phage prohead protease
MMERKLFELSSVEVKFFDDKPGTFAGYASVFNGLDTYGDTIKPGAYKKTLKNRERPVAMRWNHWGPVIGKWTVLKEDEKGLYVEGELTPGHSVAQDVYASLKHGAVSGLSIGFRVKDYKELPDGKRELREIDLVEISIVEEPADNAARVSGIKAVVDEIATLKDAEDCLRDACGLSRSDATALVSRIKAIARGERERELSAEAEIAAKIRAAFGL